MIQLYKASNTNYSNNGDFVLSPTLCELKAELNGSWVLSMEHPVSGFWREIVQDAVLSVPTFVGNSQLFRIYKVEKSDGSVTATAYPIFFDSANNVFVMDARPTGKTGQQALDILMTGTEYSGSSNITSVATAYFSRRNLMDCINGTESPSFIERWGGEILYDNFRIIINSSIGANRGVVVRYGKNITGVEYDVDESDVVTRIYPVGYNGRTLSTAPLFVDAPNVNDFATVHAKKYVFENIKLAADADYADESDIICQTPADLDVALRAAATNVFTRDKVNEPVVSVTVDLLTLADTAEYAPYAEIETLSLGDTVKLVHTKLGIESEARVVSLTWDCCLKRVTGVTLGEYEMSFAEQVASTVRTVSTITDESHNIVADKVKGILDAAKTQLRYQKNISETQDVRAILFEDLDPDSPTYGAMCLGTQGFEISTSRNAADTDWEWTTFGTAEGFSAGCMITGLLTDQTGTNYWNLDTGEFSLSSKIIADSTNLLLNPYDLTSEHWTYSGTLESGIEDPEGGHSAFRLTATGTNSYVNCNSSNNNPITSIGLYTLSVWLKATNPTTIIVSLNNTNNQKAIQISQDWQNYVFTETVSAISSNSQFTIGGWNSYSTESNAVISIYNPCVHYAQDFYNYSQSEVFNILTNNGTAQGIYLNNGLLYINATYMNTGLLTDQTGTNYWNLTTGEFSLTPKVVREAENLLKDPFGLGSEYWNMIGGSIAIDAMEYPPYSDGTTGGVWCITPTSTNCSLNARATTNAPIKSKGGYKLVVWLKTDSAIDFDIIVSLGNTVGIRRTVTVTSDWQKYEVYAYLNTVTTSAQVTIGGWSSFGTGSGGNLYVYNPCLTEAPTQEDLFNSLTDYGATQGIYLSNGQLYINASYIATGILADVNQNMVLNLATGDITMKKGSINLGNGAFSVTSAGVLTATNATLTGEVTATTGKVGNWEISGNTLVGRSTNGDIEVVLSSKNSAPVLTVRKNFGYDPDPEAITVDNWQNILVIRYTGAIESYARNSSGTQTGIFKVDNGNVTASGTFTATNADLTGKVTATEGTIGGLAITQQATRLVGTSSTGLTRFFIASQGADNDTLLRAQYRSSTSDSWTATKKTFEIDYDGRVFMRGKGALSRNYAPVVFDMSSWATITDPTGDVANSGWVYYLSSSSKRYKDVERDMTAEDIENLYQIQPVIAKYKDGYLADVDEGVGKYMPMFIAENVEEFLPEAASHNSEGMTEDWNYRVMIPAMFQMIKSQKETIDAQEEKINKLEERLAALEKKLEDLGL